MAVGVPPNPIGSYAIDGFLPDKEALWKYPAISDGWFRIHNTIRAEMGKFRAMLVRVSQETVMQDWQIDALKTYWKGHFQIVHTHHGHEENLFNPILVHHQGSQAEFQKFMAQEGIPFFVWYLEFKKCRTMYREKMETLVQRVLTGVQPANTSKKELADAINFDPSISWKVA